MSDIKTRLRKIVGPNVSKFARMIGENRQTIDNYLLGRMPRAELLRKLAEKTNININWLLTGEGPKELPVTTPINIITLDEYKELPHHQIYDKDCIFIPIISESVAASDLSTIKKKDIVNFACVRKTWVKEGHTYRCLQARGNCMYPIIGKGFIVAINLNENDPLKLERQMVAFNHQGKIRIRYLTLTEKEYVLSPHNAAEGKPIVIPRTAPNPIIGKVAWWYGQQK